jgi:hypothetical protein
MIWAFVPLRPSSVSFPFSSRYFLPSFASFAFFKFPNTGFWLCKEKEDLARTNTPACSNVVSRVTFFFSFFCAVER